MRYVKPKADVWRQRFAYLPTEVGAVGGKKFVVWWEYYQERWLPKKWVWERRVVPAPPGFKSGKFIPDMM